jgi:hypothetical protein
MAFDLNAMERLHSYITLSDLDFTLALHQPLNLDETCNQDASVFRHFI